MLSGWLAGWLSVYAWGVPAWWEGVRQNNGRVPAAGLGWDMPELEPGSTVGESCC